MTEKKKKQQQSSKKRLRIESPLLAILIIIVILSSVTAFRELNKKPLLPAGESYYNLRMAYAIKTNPLLTTDPIQNSPYQLNPYHYLLALMLFLVPSQLACIILSWILGVASAIIFFKLLTLSGLNHKDAFYSLIILAATPAFITLFTGLYLIGFVVFLSLLIIFLIIKSKRNMYALVLSALLLLVLALTSLVGFLLTLLILLSLCREFKLKSRKFMIPTFPSILALIFLIFFSVYKPSVLALGFHSFEFRQILSILRAEIGFDLFFLLLFLAGFIISWAKNEEKRPLYLAVLGFFAFSLFNTVARAFLSFIITVYCVVAIKYFYKRKWELEIVRTGTLLLLLCSIVFSLTNQINILVPSPPDKETGEALLFLKTLDKGKVFSYEDNGFLIEFYSEKSVMLDSNSFLLPNYWEIRWYYDNLLTNPRLKDSEPIIKKYDISYVLITEDMKEELWGGREEGLWFMIRNSEGFVRRYKGEDIEIWEYKPSAYLR